MRVLEKNRKEIELRMNEMGDYVKMSYLESCLGQHLDFDTRKFVLVKLGEIYESRRMFNDAGRVFRAGADINTTIKAKVEDFLKSAELFVRGENYESAETSMKKALSISGREMQSEIRLKVKGMIMRLAKEFLKQGKRKKAMLAYEALIEMELAGDEVLEIQKELLEIYNKLGKIREYYALKKVLKNKDLNEA